MDLPTIAEKTPAFYKKIDNYLLTNAPDVWASRVHGVAAVGLSAYILSGLALAVYPFTPAQFLFAESFFALSFILPSLAFFYYVYQQRLFRPTKDYGFRGKSPVLRSYRNFNLIFLSVSTFVFFPFFLSQVWVAKMDASVSTKTLARDVNVLTQGEPFLENGYFHIDRLKDGKIQISPYLNAEGRSRYDFSHSKYISTHYLPINNETKVEGVIKGPALEKALTQPMTEAEALRRIGAYLDVYKRYGHEIKALPEKVLQANFDLAKENRERPATATEGEEISDYHPVEKYISDPDLKFKQDALSSEIRALQSVKLGAHRFQEYQMLGFFLIACFYLSFAIFIFNQTNVRNIFISIAVLAIASIAFTFFAAISNAWETGAVLALFGFAVCLGLSVHIFALTRYARLNEIALFSFAITTPFAPILLGGLVPRLSGNDSFLLLVFGLFISVALTPLYEALFVRLKALPEK